MAKAKTAGTLPGSIDTDQVIWIDGRMTGVVRAATLIVGDSAHVEGELIATTLIVRGCVRGVLRATNLFLQATARVEGDVFQQALTVQPGAYLEGNCRRLTMSRGPVIPAWPERITRSPAARV